MAELDLFGIKLNLGKGGKGKEITTRKKYEINKQTLMKALEIKETPVFIKYDYQTEILEIVTEIK